MNAEAEAPGLKDLSFQKCTFKIDRGNPVFIYMPIWASAALLILLLPSLTFSQVSVQNTEIKKQIYAELRIGACAYRAKDYEAAQLHFEKASKLDPLNKNAFMYAAWAAYKQYQKGIKKESNVAKAREATFLLSKVVEIDPLDVAAANNIAAVYADLEPDQLLKRAEDETQPKQVRAAIYVSLAAKMNTCANDVTDTPETKYEAVVGANRVFRYKMPANRADFNRGKSCAHDGLELVDKALKLAPDLGSAASYQAGLLIQNAHLAEMENDAAAKASYQKQFVVAKANYSRLSDIARDKQAEKDKEEDQRYAKSADLVKKSEMAKMADFIATELMHKEPGDPVRDMYDPFIQDPVFDANGGDRSTYKATDPPKAAVWMPFELPTYGLSIMMPSPVDPTSGHIFTAKDQSVSYAIYVGSNPEGLERMDENVKLASAAWAFADGFACNLILIGNGVCDVSLAAKSNFDSHPALQYHLKDSRCDHVESGVIRSISTKDHIYILYVYGADENDPRAKKFLESLKLTDKQ